MLRGGGHFCKTGGDEQTRSGPGPECSPATSLSTSCCTPCFCPNSNSLAWEKKKVPTVQTVIPSQTFKSSRAAWMKHCSDASSCSSPASCDSSACLSGLVIRESTCEGVAETSLTNWLTQESKEKRDSEHNFLYKICDHPPSIDTIPESLFSQSALANT